VVPPQKVTIQPGRGEKAATTGRLVGWIELDPNPLPPPAKQ
jgi:hypothetical protein